MIFRKERESELDKEIQFHLERQVADYRRSGMSEAEARRQARLEFGGVEQVKYECREVRGTLWFDALAQDFRFALRGFQRSKRFALSAGLAIALAVGAATAVFSVVDRNLFRPLPYGFADRLVSVGMVAPVIHSQDWVFAGTYREWKVADSAFEAMTAWRGVSDCDRHDGTPERLGCAQVAADFLPVLGVVPFAGLNFLPEEDVDGGEPVAVISNGFWRTRFGGDAAALGRLMTIDGVATRIIGILPAGFETPSLAAADVLVPMRLPKEGQRQRLVHVIGRVRPGESAALTGTRLAPLFEQFLATMPADFRKAVPVWLRVATLRDQQTREYRLALSMLLGAVLSFVLIACANVANLLLARSATRRHEFAVRASLGASNWRLARQTLTESIVLGAAGGAAGCGLAYGLLRLFQDVAPAGAPRMGEAALDLRVLVFAAGLSLLAAMVFGLAPAMERLRGESFAEARVAGRRRNWLRPALVSLQLSLSTALLISTGLFLLSLWRLQTASLGFAPETVVTASFVLPAQGYPTNERQIAFFDELERRLAAVPGFVSVAITDSLPPGGDPRSRPYVAFIGGGNSAERGLEGTVKWRYVTPGYFDTLGIRVRRGNSVEGRQAIVVSESLAKRLFGEADPMGKLLRLEEPMEIAGVAADVRNSGVDRAADAEFYALRGRVPTGVYRNQRPPFGWRRASAVVRSGLPVGVVMDLMREKFRDVDPRLAVVTGTMTREVNQYYARPRFQTVLLALFAFIGLALAGVGLYGLTSFLAAERTREIGVRIALGATPVVVVRMMMREGMAWTGVGVVAGAAVSVALARGMRALLFEVQPLDWRVFGGAVAVLVIVALAGTWIPSARASRIEPMEVLRRD
ncbi:MAG: ADOP family duplicated permease [Bryobacteraceae bacterium]